MKTIKNMPVSELREDDRIYIKGLARDVMSSKFNASIGEYVVVFSTGSRASDVETQYFPRQLVATVRPKPSRACVRRFPHRSGGAR